MKADTKAIQAIGDHVITHNTRVSVSHDRKQRHHLHITNVSLEDAGPYMCQLNTDPMKSQVERGTLRHLQYVPKRELGAPLPRVGRVQNCSPLENVGSPFAMP